jgi:hypothetical protein
MRTARRHIARLRLALAGLMIVAGVGLSSAVTSAWNPGCSVSCGPCTVQTNEGCGDCSAWNQGNACGVSYGSSCTATCDCGGDPGWYCC